MSTIAAGTTSGTALVSTGDTTGTLVLQTNGTTTAVTIGTNQVVTLVQPLPIASGGTNSTATPTAGGVHYGTGTAAAFTAAGTSGQVLTSAGSSAPTWTTPSVLGATDVGSVILTPNQSFFFTGYAANPSVSITNAWTYLPGQPYSSSGTLSFGQTSYVPVYSSYYGGWLSILNINQTSTIGVPWICLSTNGIYWRPIMRAISSTFNPGSGYSYAETQMYNVTAPIAVDETTGRIYTVWTDNASNYVGIARQTTIGSQASTWTDVQIVLNGQAYSQTPTAAAFAYVNMGGVTANSGLVFMGKDYGGGTRIYTLAAGTVSTFTSRFSGSGPANNSYGGNMVYSYSGLKAFAITPNGTGCCSVATNVNQAWTAMTNLTNTPGSNQTGLQAMSASYNVYGTGGSTLYYSTTFGSWTATSPGLGSLNSLTHNGTYWLLKTTQGLYYSSSATPTGWTATGFFPSGSTDTWPFALRQY